MSDYVLLLSDGYRFFLPVEYVCRIGPWESGDFPEAKYRISLEYEGNSWDIPAEDVHGVVSVSEEEIVPLPACTRSEENRYLKGIVCDKNTETIGAYVFDVPVLYAKMMQEAQDQGKGRTLWGQPRKTE